jgi:VWFA-related protein
MRKQWVRTNAVRWLLLLLQVTFPLAAQQGTASGADKQLQQRTVDTTIQVSTHLTIEDILVTDASGKAVRGLPRSAFHIVDDKTPQVIRDFAESSDVPPKVAPVEQGVYGNSLMVHHESTVNVLLIDPIGVEIADQMFLRLQALKYLKTMPEGTTMAVFRTSNDGRPLLVQSLTQDRDLLTKAVNRCVPTYGVRVPTEQIFFNAVGEVSNIADYLRQVEGRKSLIWFAGQFPLALPLGGNGAEQGIDYDQSKEALKSVYRKLEASRVAVFPIDVRGVVDASLALNRPAGSNQPGQQMPTMAAGGAAEQQGSWNEMDELASATGGHAFYSNNRLAGELESAVDLGRHFYTLSYNPKPYAEDGSWHTVKIMVDGPYKLSYRNGYFAKPSAETQRLELAKRTDKDRGYTTDDGPANVPILFQAKIRPDTGTSAPGMVVQYAIAANDLSFTPSNVGVQQAQFKVAALAYDISGDVLSSAVDDVSTHYSPAQMDEVKRIGVPMLQKIEIKKGAKFLLLTVIDIKTGRTGTVQLGLESIGKNAP